MLPPLASGISGAAASALLLPPSLSPGAAAAAAAAAAASASAAGTAEHALHAADAIARGYLQGDNQDDQYAGSRRRESTVRAYISVELRRSLSLNARLVETNPGLELCSCYVVQSIFEISVSFIKLLSLLASYWRLNMAAETVRLRLSISHLIPIQLARQYLRNLEICVSFYARVVAARAYFSVGNKTDVREIRPIFFPCERIALGTKNTVPRKRVCLDAQTVTGMTGV